MERKHDAPLGIADIKRMVDRHLRERGLGDKWLYEAMGMSRGSYYDMWRRGSVRAVVLGQMAHAFGMTLSELLSEGPTIAADPIVPYGAKRFIEQRIDELERRMADLEGEHRKRRMQASKQ